jgi:chromosome segregation ATPase
MLQDLDHITGRIGQLAERTRLLKAERDALRVRLEDGERAVRHLREHCAQRDAALLTLQARLSDQDGQLERKLEAAQRHGDALQEQLTAQCATHAVLNARLVASQADVDRLKQVAGTARQRIDAVLACLPGAPPPPTADVITCLHPES